MSQGITATLDRRQLRRLEAMLKRLPAKDAKKALRKASRAGSKIITKAVKKRGCSDLKTHEKNLIVPAVKTKAVKRSRRYVGTTTTIGTGFFKGDTFYAAFVELGHKQGSRKLANRRQIKGVGFMRNAVQDVKARAGRKAVMVLRREIIAAAKR